MKNIKKWIFRKSDGRRENLDPRQLSLPVGMERPESLQEKMKRLVRDEVLQQKLSQEGVETFEEADDFDIPDDPVDPTTPYEEHYDPKGMTAREQEVRSGFVEDVSEQRVMTAREKIQLAKEQIAAAKKAIAAAKKGDQK